MDKSLRTKFDSLDSQLRDLFESLKYYNDSQLNRQPQPGTWSINQNLYHLMESERLSQAYIEKKLSFNPDIPKTSIGSRFRMLVLWASMVSPFKFKAPEIIDTTKLPVDTKFWETVKRWKEQRASFRGYLETLPADTLNRLLYKHPAAGKLNASQMMWFLDLHFNRHRRAIDKIAKGLTKVNEQNNLQQR